MEHLIPQEWFSGLGVPVLLVVSTVALAALVKGADWLVEGASGFAYRAGLPKVIVGATIVARHAGEMIGLYTTLMTHKLGLGALTRVIQPYPTQAEAVRKTGDAYQRTRLTPFVKKLMARWFAWQRRRHAR